LLAVWILGTYLHQAFPAYPYIHLNGPTGSGKTKIAQIVQQLAFNGMLSANMSAAYIFRAVEAFKPTICLDEAECFENGRDERSRDIYSLFNSGYKKGAKVGRVEKGEDGIFRLIHLDAYSPKLLAGIAGINPVLASRCIQIPTMISGDTVVANRQIDTSDATWEQARDVIHAAVLGNFGCVVAAKHSFKDEGSIIGRNWELWKPMLMIASAISSEVRDDLRNLSLHILEQQKELRTETSDDVLMLRALERLTDTRPSVNGYTTREILDALQHFYLDEFGKGYQKIPADQGRWIGTRLRQLRVVTGPAVTRSVRGKKNKHYLFDNTVIQDRLKVYGMPIDGEETEETTETTIQAVQRIFNGEVVAE
jgi:hypothetical protein